MTNVKLAAILVLAVAGTASAAPLTPQQLYVAGKYEPAIHAGVAENNSAGFAVAAHAALAEATMRAPCLECLARAEGLARRAVALNPRLPEGHLYLAVALGYEARIRGAVAARLHGLVEEAKSHLDAALAADPQNARVLAAIGGWNIAIAAKAGGTLARWLYGASLEQGLKAYARAFKAGPQDIALDYQYALSLAAYDAVGYRREIETALSRTVRGNPLTAYDSITQARAGTLLRLLKSNDDKGFRQAVRRYQGYPEGASTDSPKSHDE